MKILVTGANGFVGSNLVHALKIAGHEVIGSVREEGARPSDSFIRADSSSDFSKLLDGFDAVVHAAGVAHNPTSDPVELKRLFDEGNLRWTQSIADAVTRSEVKTMVHISSIAAAGDPPRNSSSGFGERDESDPKSDYGASKRAAETYVNALQAKGRLGVNLRPPLIYGVGTKGNWAKILKLARTPFPIPFSGVSNQRSYLGMDNLSDLVICILEKSDRADLSGTYHVADEGSYSLSEVIEAIRAGL
ncbi:MAG: NAD-dependent epimerase/dehydratase family protein, partial [Verrucomicrobiota bacterium]